MKIVKSLGVFALKNKDHIYAFGWHLFNVKAGYKNASLFVVN